MLKKSQQSLKDWSKQDWGTKSGKKSSETGERYLPKAARESLSDSEYAATTAAKRKDKAAGKQHSKQPKKIAEKTARYRKNKGGLTDAEVINMVEDKSWFKRATQPGGDKYKGKHTLLTASSGDGTKEYLVEVKPKKQTEAPKPQKKQTRRYVAEVMTYAKNDAKWRAAQEFCRDRRWEFRIITERELRINYPSPRTKRKQSK